MPKQHLSMAQRGGDRDNEELTELMALLESPADADDEEVSSGELVALLEGLGATAREREEHEVRALLERMPELEEGAREGAASEEEAEVEEIYFESLTRREPEPEPEPVTLQDLFAISRPRPVRVEEAPVAVVASSPSALPPVRDPLAARRAVADRRLEDFVREDIGTRLNFRVLRFLMVTGLERITVEELQEELVEAREELRSALARLEASGLVSRESVGYSINPRARKLTLLASAISQWQSPRRRDEVWSWLEPR